MKLLNDLLRPFQAEASTAVKEILETEPKPEPIQVASRHIPLISEIYDHTLQIRDTQKSRKEYLDQVARTGVRAASINIVRDSYKTDKKILAETEAALLRIKMVLAAGCEPTTPPQEWFHGFLEEPPKDQWGDYDVSSFDRSWPGKSVGGNMVSRVDVFVGAIPPSALTKYAAVKGLVDSVKVYSPRSEDFRTFENPMVADPVLIGVIRAAKKRYYFEIARWDVDKDLADLFSR